MTLSRLVLLFVVTFVSVCACAADAKQQVTTPDASWNTPLETLRLVPWFTGMKHVSQDVKRASKPSSYADRVVSTPAAVKGVSCLKLRTYKIKGQETLSGGESGFVSYSTCQWVTNYQVRTAV